MTAVTAPSTGCPVAPIRCVNLCRTFVQGDSEIRAVDQVNVEVAHGEFLAIMGRSGSGKSTLLHLIGALDQPDAGQVILEGRDIASLPERELAIIRRRRLGFLLQFFSLLPTMNACENVAFPLTLDGAPAAAQRARETLREVGLEHRLGHRPSELSGGEQQRVALARALVSRPAVVLADEPTGNLDSAGSKEILQLLRRAADSGQTIVIATHEHAIGAYADRTLQLEDGRVDVHTSARIALR
jgi:putative ABC transport system ATP-binding protein